MYMRLATVCVIALILAGGYLAMDRSASASDIESYEWGRIVSPEALAKKRADLIAQSPPESLGMASCPITLDYAASDARMVQAELFIVMELADRQRWLAYRGPVRDRLELSVPDHIIGISFPVEISAEAIADDDLHVISWTSYGAFPLVCGDPRWRIRLLDHVDMAGTGGDLHIVGPSE